MKNAKYIARGILYLSIPIAFLIMINTYIIEIHFIVDYLIIFIISIIGSLITRDMEDGMLAGFYGSSLALILWLCIPIIISYILPIFTLIFTISDFMVNISYYVIHFTLEILLIILFYKQKLRFLLISLIIMFIIFYVNPLVIVISVELGYMTSWGGVIQLILDFLLNVVVVIILSTFSGLFGGWIGMNLLKKYQDDNFNEQQVL